MLSSMDSPSLILILLHTKFMYGNILDKFVFQHSRTKVKVTVVVRGNIFFIFLAFSSLD